MTLSRNQEYGFVVARLLTSVGLRLVSIGPPIIVIVRGSRGSPALAISEMAASTGTVGWQTEITWTSGPSLWMNSIT